MGIDDIPRPSVGQILNTISGQLAGPERRTLFGAEGDVRLPLLSADELSLAQPNRARLAQTRVYLLPGTPWPGARENGSAWLEPWARSLQHMGVGRAVPIRYAAPSFVRAIAQAFSDPVLKTSERRAMEAITADLQAHPLAPGERIYLLGHSYGNRVGAVVAERLQGQGLPVAGMVMMETHLPDLGQIAPRAPAIGRVVEIENERSRLQVPAGTELQRLRFPQLTHMEMVVRPTAELMNGVVRALAD